MRRWSRTLWAAVLLVGAMAVLLAGWFFAGWSDVRARQAEANDAPLLEAARRSDELARDLRLELDRLIGREIERPYFHYQNLYRDPRASVSVGVTPSPLASGEADPLVLGYFQIDAKGKVTTPTINDDVPDLSDTKRLAQHTAFRAQVASSLGTDFRPPATASPTFVATVEPAPRRRPRPETPPQQASQQRTEPIVQSIDLNSYAQNSNSNSIYLENVPRNLPQLSTPPDAGAPEVAPEAAGAAAATELAAPVKSVPRVVTTSIQKLEDRQVTIVVSPLALQTHAFGGGPVLVATRLVETPDGALTQGFVVDPAKVGAWLAARHEGATLVHRPEARQVADGWGIDVPPAAGALAAASASAGTLATTFLVRFVVLGVLAVIAAMLVVIIVARAERLARERSQFAAAAAHELRTPLAGLQLYGDMLADGLGDPDKQRDYAKRMAEEAARLGRVVSNVLGFSQLERGNLSVDPKPGDVAAELAELAARAEPALDRAGAALSLEVTPGLRATFDRDALARIVGNLLDNAEKYSRDVDDRTITLAARAAGQAVEIEVRDHGPGVAPAARSRLFTAFVRGVDADGPAGLGLGLALSQSLARAMGGELDYRPPSDGGAGFVLRLAPAAT